MGIAAIVIEDVLRDFLNQKLATNKFNAEMLVDNIREVSARIETRLIHEGVPVNELMEDVCYVTLDSDHAIDPNVIREHASRSDALEMFCKAKADEKA